MASNSFSDLTERTDLRSRQTEAIKRMINFNAPLKSTTAEEPAWKVLVYDKYGQDIISPVLSVPELRDRGVTLHLQLHSKRDQVADVPAVYFVLPTAENIARICQDIRSEMYESYYFNFVTAVPRQRLEEIATAAIESDAVASISKIVDQYQSFLSLEDDMFVVRQHDLEPLSYYGINRSDAQDTDMQVMRDTIVESLFALFVTLGTVPVIRCPRGNAAEMIAEALDKKLRENLRDTRNSLFTGDTAAGQFSFQRPLLILLDRSLDLATPLHHSWTYQALIHDLMELSLNRVTVRSSGPEATTAGAAASSGKAYDLSSTDQFWQQHRGSAFPTVADSVQAELKEYQAAGDRVKDLKVATDEEDSDGSALMQNTQKLSSALGSVPELLEKKKALDMHTNLASALLEQIKDRKLDMFFDAEEKILSKSTLDRPVLEIIQDPQAGTALDKLRLFLICYLMSSSMTDADLSQHVEALEAAGADVAAVSYLKKWKAFSQMAAPASRAVSSVASSSFSLKSMIKGVKDLVVTDKNLPVTRVVESLMDMSHSTEIEDYRYLDPKVLRQADSAPKSRAPFREAVVFVVGGGNYIEYQNLQDFCKRSNGSKHISYGTSELVNAQRFVDQLARLV
eukprot:scpid60804/ scgid5571/ Sec1 family domain-containing protein 1; SLY1 homolog; Syntaxin-binding protein 1-like 2